MNSQQTEALSPSLVSTHNYVLVYRKALFSQGIFSFHNEAEIQTWASVPSPASPLHIPPEFSGEYVLNAEVRCNIQVLSIMKALQMYICSFRVAAMIRHVSSVASVPSGADWHRSQKSSYKEASGIRFPRVVQEMCLGGKQNYSFRLTFETFIIWDEENASYCFSFVKWNFHDNFVLYCSQSAFLW